MVNTLSSSILAASVLLASRYTFAAPFPVNSPPHSKATPSSQGASHHSSHGVEWHAPPVPTHKKLLITSTDAKVDDKLAMTANERIGGYTDHDIHYNGVVDVDNAHAFTSDWFKHLDEAGKGKFHSPKRRFYQGGTPFKEDGKDVPATGEHLFRDYKIAKGEIPPLHKLSTAHLDFAHHKGKHADFFSQAPIPEKELLDKLKAYADAGVVIDNAAHVEGFNSRQDLASRKKATPETAQFVQGFRANVRKFHPKANVILTHSKHNFGKDANGSTQPYSDLVGRMPHHHLQTVGEKDPFAMNQIETAAKYIHESGQQPHPFLGTNGESITAKEMWQARRNKKPSDTSTIKLRENVVKAIEANKPLLKDAHIRYRLDAVKSGIEHGCQGETCDANHAVLLHHAMQKGEQGFDNVHVDNEIILHKPDQEQQHHAITPRFHPDNKAIVTQKLKEVFPIVDHPAFDEREDNSA